VVTRQKTRVKPQDVVVLERFWGEKTGEKVPFLTPEKEPKYR